jgi:amidophosphoribosyltransferase
LATKRLAYVIHLIASQKDDKNIEKIRSTTMQSLLRIMRELGKAKEIHVRVACPPIVAPCFYGIDMSTIGELFAPKFMHPGDDVSPEVLRQMAKSLGADSLRYLSRESLARAIDLPADDLCRACVGAGYPTPEGQRLYQVALQAGANGTVGRVYDRIAAVR